MLLMRLSDAIRETAGTTKVHRSHWVAQSQIVRIDRRGDGGVLTMQGDTEIPVSRSGMKLLQSAGLLPTKGR